MKTVTLVVLAFLGGSIVCLPTVAGRARSPQCLDPTFACQDLRNARDCGVTSDCINDIWSTMSVPDNDDDICQICKEMVKEARDQLLSNMTQEEIKQVFEGSCKLLPVKLVADACIKLVDEFIPQLVEMLASRMDPTMVCTVSGLCIGGNGPYRKALSAIINKHAFASECDRCTTVVSSVKEAISSVPEEDLKKFISHLVSNIEYDPIRSNEHFSDSVYEFLTSTMEPKGICSASGACPVTCEVNNEPKDELVCEFCTNVLEHVKGLITANTTVEEFRTALLNFCNHTGSFSSRCTTYVDEYFDTVFQYIRTMDSKGVCTLIGLCNNDLCIRVSAVKVVPAFAMKKKFPAIKLMPSLPVKQDKYKNFDRFIKVAPSIMPSKKVNRFDEDEAVNEIFGSSDRQLPFDRFSHPILSYQQNLECNFCKAISFYLKKDLKGDTTQESVDRALRNGCEKWASEYPDYCKSFLGKYASKITESIVKTGDVENVCYRTETCIVEDDNSGVKISVVTPKEPTDICDLCKTTCNEIVSQLKDPSVKKSVEKTLYQVCNYLPKSMTDDCHKFINDNIDNLFSILEQELDGDNICPALHLCSGGVRQNISEKVKDIECDLCKDFVQQLQEKLKEPDVKQYCKNFLDNACAKLPQGIRDECKDFFDQNLDNLINIIVQYLDPNEVCTALSICHGSFVPKPKPKKVKNIECDLCKEIVAKVDEKLKEGSTEEEIKEVLDKVCSYLPSSMATRCENFVNQYSAAIVTILAEEMDPTLVCAALNVCPAKRELLQRGKAKAQDIECEGCQYLFHFIQEQLMSSATQDNLKDTMKKICKLLPGTYSENCAAFVDEFGSSLLAIIAQQLDPSIMCKMIDACQGNKTKLVFEPYKEVTKNLELDKCTLCTTVVDYLDKLLEEDDVDKEITLLVEKVCTIVPASLKDKCSTLIETYGPYLLEMIGQVADSKAVCQEIDMCARTKGQVHLLGGNKCTFGPSYWCQSKVHASACKAENYCRQNVWSK